MSKQEHIANDLLVLRAQDGDAGAMEQLVDAWQSRLWAFARVLTRDDAEAWDVLQEAWLAVVSGLRHLHDPSRFRPWIFRIVRHKATDRIRMRQRQRRLESEQMERVASERTYADTDMRDMLGALPDQSGSLLALHYLEGFDYEELAAILEVPLGTVKSRLYKARQDLKTMLEQGHG
ncbi:MAG: sigma-70 family RNA polymerase sigma factor [Candidatus Hydrogenedentes bacterium]|nr:sigma-70 family RNA polymerase sigma factor [Candidatus Hydrogenedentota bacterium]